MNYYDIYLIIASASTIIVAFLLFTTLFYVFSILHDIKKLSKIARKEAEIIAKGFEKGATVLGSELSTETASFVKTVFGLLLTHFVQSGGSQSVSRKRAVRAKSEEV